MFQEVYSEVRLFNGEELEKHTSCIYVLYLELFSFEGTDNKIRRLAFLNVWQNLLDLYYKSKEFWNNVHATQSVTTQKHTNVNAAKGGSTGY